MQSSQATFIHTDQIDQQFAITRLRALETGRWVAVATTNGVSGIIAPDGDVVATADTRTSAVLVQQVGLSDALTPAIRIGPWSGRVAMILTALGVLLVLLPYRRRDRQDAGPEEGASTDLPRPGQPSRWTIGGRTMSDRSGGSSWSSRPSTRPTTSPG